MRRIKWILAAAAVMAAMLAFSAGPAMAADRHNNNDTTRCRDFSNDLVRCNGDFFVNTDRAFGFPVFVNDGRFFDDDFFDDGFFFNGVNNDFFDPFFNDNGIPQQNEQEVQSGAVSQGVIVEGGGANSNQCVGVQPIANTGNATNNTGVVQANPFNNGFDNRFFDDGFNNPFFNDGFGNGQVDIQDTGNLTISPSQTVTCTQQVNQAATASG